MTIREWIVVGFCVGVLGMIAFGTIKAWNNPYAEVTKIAEDGTIWIQVGNIGDNTSFYLYHDDIEKGTHLELVE